MASLPVKRTGNNSQTHRSKIRTLLVWLISLHTQVESGSLRIWKCTEQKPRCAIQWSINDSCAYTMKNSQLNASCFVLEMEASQRHRLSLYLCGPRRCSSSLWRWGVLAVTSSPPGAACPSRSGSCCRGGKAEPNTDCDITPEGSVRRKLEEPWMHRWNMMSPSCNLKQPGQHYTRLRESPEGYVSQTQQRYQLTLTVSYPNQSKAITLDTKWWTAAWTQNNRL